MEPDPAGWKECRAADKWPTDESSASYKARTSTPTTTMPATTMPTATAAKPRLRRRRNQYGANYAHHYERGQILESHGIAPAWERITPARLMDRQGGLFLSKSRFRHRSEAAVALQHDDTASLAADLSDFRSSQVMDVVGNLSFAVKAMPALRASPHA
jgi:hypothetical protein